MFSGRIDLPPGALDLPRLNPLSHRSGYSAATFNFGLIMQPAMQALSELQLLMLLPIQRQGDWLDACLMYGGGHEIQLTQVASAQQMAEQLHEYIFDLVLFWYEGTDGPALPVCRQLMEMADHQGFAAIGMHAVEGWEQPLLHGGAIACLDMDWLDPVSLVHTLRNSCELIRLRHERHQWQIDRKRQQERDARDVQRLLAGQRKLLGRLDQLGGGPSVSVQPFDSHQLVDIGANDLLDRPIGQSYCTVLQNYLFDDTHISGTALTLLAEHFLATRVDSSQIMRLHVAAVSRVTAHGGSNALRHCLASADRFLLELLMRLVDRQRSETAVSPEIHAHFEPVTSPLAAA